MTVKSSLKSNHLQIVKQQYGNEYLFISNLLGNVDLPCQDSECSDSENESKFTKVRMLKKEKDIDRAKTLVELNNRLSSLREQKYTYKGKKLKNRLQSKLKKKKKVFENKMKRNSVSKEQMKSETVSKNTDIKIPKPIFNNEGNMVFSKFDFLGATSNLNNNAAFEKETKSKKLALEKLEKERAYIQKLEKTGEVDKANKIKEESVWNNALKKSEGLKVKDNPALLKKSLAKKKAKKKASEKKWKERITNVEKQKEERQKKRSENIMKHRQEAKKKKLKKAVKKGRVIPNA